MSQAHAQLLAAADPTRNSFDLSLSLGQRYTTNPELGAAGGREGDFITDLRADFQGRRSSPRTAWSGKYTPFYTRYATNDQFNSTNHALEFDGRYSVSRRTQVRLLENFFYSRTPLQIGAADPTDPAVILTRQTKRWRSYSDLDLESGLSRSVTLLTGASARLERFDLNPPVKTDTYSGHVGVQKQIGRVDNITSTLIYSRFGFHRDDLDDASSEGVDVSWSHKPPAPTDWTLSAGATRVTRGDDRQTKLTAGASLHHPFRRIDFVSSYRRSIGSDAGVSNVTVAQNAYAGISGKVGRRASLGVLGEYGTRDSLLGTGDRLSLSYTGGSLHGAVSLNPRLSLSGEARRRKQDATGGTGEDLTVNTYFLGLVFQVF